jgi:hypothetical protein
MHAHLKQWQSAVDSAKPSEIFRYFNWTCLLSVLVQVLYRGAIVPVHVLNVETVGLQNE